jgi:hypothetical protein
VVAHIRVRLAASKEGAQTLDVERFNLKKLGKLEIRKEFRIRISERFAALQI